MTVIFIVLPLALLMAAPGVAAFIWMARTGQMDDLESPAVRMLFDDEDVATTPEDAAERGPGTSSA